MRYVNLGNTGAKVSEICLGAMLCGTAVDKSTSFKILDHFMEEAGGNFIDTANCYAWWMGEGEYIGDESETILGQWMRERKNRDKVFLATKVGGRLKNPYTIRNAVGEIYWDKVPGEYEGLSKNVIIREVENSLRRLKTDYLDLYYSHVYDDVTPIEETMEALTTLVKEGKVRYLGASNLSANQLANANEVSKQNNLSPYSVLQSEYTFLHPTEEMNADTKAHASKELLNYTTAESMAFCAYSPVLKGIYTNREKRDQYYNWHLFKSEKNIQKLELVETLSKKLNMTGNQLVLAWMLRKSPQIIPILGFSKMDQYLDNIKACELVLPEEIFHILEEAE